MTTAMQQFKYSDEEIRFIDDHEQEGKTYEQTQITSNVYQYDYQKSPKRKWSNQFVPQKYHKNYLSSYTNLTNNYRSDNKNKHNYRNKTYSNFEHKQQSHSEFINEDHTQNKKVNLESTDIDNNQYEPHTITTVEPQKSKTPITLINEWAMRGSCEKKRIVVSYTLVAITGHAHKPIFTYMCQVNDKSAKGEGLSKKEAKQNAAAQMWEKLLKVNSTTNNNDKAITSTTITDNLEVNENDTTNFTSTEGSQIINETDSNMEDEEMQHSNYDMVKIAHRNMNPVGALQELSTTYKWTPPFYSFQKLGPLKKDQQQNGVFKTVSYEVTCQVFHLRTTGTASTKKEAKRLAARLMFDQINNIGEEKLNKLKSSELKNDFQIEEEENQTFSLKWSAAQYFQSYFTAAISEAVNNTSDLSSLDFLFKGNKEEEEIKIITEYQNELEQSVDFNPNLSAVYKLQALSQQLNFQVTYMCVNDNENENMVDEQQRIVKNNSDQDEEFIILLQVTTIPVIATTGHAKSLYKAAEVAANSILYTIKNMLITSSSLI